MTSRKKRGAKEKAKGEFFFFFAFMFQQRETPCLCFPPRKAYELMIAPAASFAASLAAERITDKKTLQKSEAETLRK
ncbi:unnamed protein product [Brassica napus]|uniref:(rape) hypothetical protein n=1 Tax=Brassica napus TaxID=3708 RepID=A0A816Q9N1_BRANA|nr:unnamed protein product [Brassica napus]